MATVSVALYEDASVLLRSRYETEIKKQKNRGKQKKKMVNCRREERKQARARKHSIKESRPEGNRQTDRQTKENKWLISKDLGRLGCYAMLLRSNS